MNFDRFDKKYCKLHPIQFSKSRSNIGAVNEERLELNGYALFDGSFDFDGDF